MENELQWKKSTSWVYKSVLIYSLSGILAAVLSVITVLSAINDAASAAGRGSSARAAEALASGYDSLEVIATLCSIAVLVGYVLFFINISKMRELVHSNDAEAVGNIRLAFMLNVANAFLTFLSLPSIITLIISIVAWVTLLTAYGKLMNSVTFPAAARVGMGRLRTATIVSIIGAFIAVIPVVGVFIGLVLGLVAFVMTIAGWKSVANSEAPVR